MFNLFKVVAFVFIFIIGFLGYIFYTSSGKQSAYHFVGVYLSKKNDLDIKIKSIDISNYPHIVASSIIDDRYELDINGDIKNFTLKGKYVLKSKCVDDIKCIKGDNIYIVGKMDIQMGYMSIMGKGMGLNGNVEYSLKKIDDRYKDVKLKLKDINSTRLAKLLGQKVIFEGKANANIDFSLIDKYHKRGIVSYSVEDTDFSNLKVKLNTKIYVNDKKHKFNISIVSKEMNLDIYDGRYDEENRYFHSFYKFRIDNLNRLKPALNMDLVGKFYAMGEMEYNKTILIKGLSKSLGGYTKFFYKDDNLSIDINSVALKNIFNIIDINPILYANSNGYIKYDFLHKKIDSKITLKDTKFISNKNTLLLSKKLDINLSREVFENSKIEIKGNHIDINLSNSKNHIIISNLKIYPKDKSLNTNIDIQLNKYNIMGELYLKNSIYISNRKLDDTYINYKGKIQKYYDVSLDGVMNKSMINMTYTLGSHRLPSHICTIVNDVNISGYINGYWNLLHIKGKGDAIDGNVYFDFTKVDNRLEDVNINLTKVHAQKLFTLFGKPSYPHGWTNAKIKFKTLSKSRQNGDIFYSLSTSKILDTPFYLNSKINIDDNILSFKANIKLANNDINITKGRFDRDTNKTYMFYKADVRDVSRLEKIIKHKYYGSIYAIGEIFYDRELKVLGISKSFGGVLDYKYYKDNLNISLSDVYLKNILHIFDIPKLLDAKTSGEINYDFGSKKVEVDTKLNRGIFLPSKLSKTIHKKSGFDLEKEIFNNSSLYLTYQKGIVLGNLMLKNQSGSISLRETKIDIKRDKINAYFDFDMTKQKFSGKVYGRLSNPKVNLDMQKLIEFQMDNQLDNIMGKDNREMMENLPMGNVAKDIGTGMAGSFMGIFF